MNNNRSLAELQSESEIARARLAATVSELRTELSDTADEVKRVASFSNIKNEVRSYIREERKNIAESIQERVRENPLQAAAIGAAIAYPAWGLLRTIPMPLLMIGAGLFLTSRRGQRVADDAKVKVDELVDQGTQKVSELVKSAQAGVIDPFAKTFTEAREAVTASAGLAADQIRRGVHDAKDALTYSATDVSQKASDIIGQTSNATQKTTQKATVHNREGIATATQWSKTSLMEFANRNPLLVAGVGIGLGMFIAASLPSSDAENTVFGKASDGVKQKARRMVSDGIDKAQDVAENVMADVTAAAGEQGIDGHGLRKTVDEITQGIKAIAERGSESVLNPAHAPNIQPTQ